MTVRIVKLKLDERFQVRCVNDWGVTDLITIGKIYTVIKVRERYATGERSYVLADIAGVDVWFNVLAFSRVRPS